MKGGGFYKLIFRGFLYCATFWRANDLLNLRRLLEPKPIMMSGLGFVFFSFTLVSIMYWLKEHESCL